MASADQPLFRFALITDTHILEPESAAILKLALGRIESMKGALSFLIFGGDMVETGEKDEYRIFLEALSNLTVPYHTVVGNHDIGDRSSRRRYSRFFGPPSYRFTVKGVECMVLDTNNSDQEPGNWHGKVEPPAMRWLSRTLHNLDSNRPIMLFTHQGLVGSREDLECDVENADEVLSLFCGHPLLGGFAGHAHRLRVIRLGTADFYICPALSTRRANKGGEPPGMLVVDVCRERAQASLYIVSGGSS